MTLDEAFARIAAAGYFAHVRQAQAAIGMTRTIPHKEWWVSLFSHDDIRHGYANTLLEAIDDAFKTEPVTVEAILYQRTDAEDSVPFDASAIRQALGVKPRPVLRRF